LTALELEEGENQAEVEVTVIVTESHQWGNGVGQRGEGLMALEMVVGNGARVMVSGGEESVRVHPGAGRVEGSRQPWALK
jgi:hypothetical protein